jgi:hypothetical protein
MLCRLFFGLGSQKSEEGFTWSRSLYSNAIDVLPGERRRDPLPDAGLLTAAILSFGNIFPGSEPTLLRHPRAPSAHNARLSWISGPV